MEKLPPSETSESEKNSPTATNTKNNLKILSFSTKKEKDKNEAKEDILDLLGVVADDVVNGIDFDVLNATTGIPQDWASIAVCGELSILDGTIIKSAAL